MGLEIIDLGLVDYQRSLEVQNNLFSAVKTGRFSSALLICRHYPVITLGRRGQKKNILATQEELKINGISVYETGRGGDVTYHSPGQVTVYPVFNLGLLKKDIHWFLRQLEGVVIDCLSDYGVEAHVRAGLTGVWIKEEKICSIGIAVRNWITFHGLSINIKTADLAGFRFIKPCGMQIKMTALEREAAGAVNIDGAKESLISKFRVFFNQTGIHLKEVVYA